MKTLNQDAENIVVAAVIAGFWSGMVMDRLVAYTVRFNMPVLHEVAQWWPVLLIVAGLTVLVRHKQTAPRNFVPARRVIMMQPRKERVHAR
jgi:hypothetical protein